MNNFLFKDIDYRNKQEGHMMPSHHDEIEDIPKGIILLPNLNEFGSKIVENSQEISHVYDPNILKVSPDSSPSTNKSKGRLMSPLRSLTFRSLMEPEKLAILGPISRTSNR